MDTGPLHAPLRDAISIPASGSLHGWRRFRGRQPRLRLAARLEAVPQQSTVLRVGAGGASGRLVPPPGPTGRRISSPLLAR